jgi:hypothetical protein
MEAVKLVACFLILTGTSAAAGPVLNRARLSPVPSAGRAEPVPTRPAWLKVESGGGRDVERAAAKIERSSRLLSRTATGRALGYTLTEKGGTVYVNYGGSFYVSDGDNQVSLGPEFALSRTDETLAVLFAHELEHLHQRSLGLAGESARGIRELAAFVVQTRAWVELGAELRESDLEANWNNSHDMAAALEYPASVMTALAYRAEFRADLSDKKVREYWSAVLAEDAAWRKRWSAKFPKRDSRESAFFVLNQALNLGGGSRSVSAWLPDVLERALTLRPGESILLPVEPTEADKALLEAHVLAPRLVRGESGSWGLVLP